MTDNDSCERCGYNMAAHAMGDAYYGLNQLCPDYVEPKKPWGHKLTISFYMEGDIKNVEMARQCLEGQVMILPSPAFVGEWVEVVQEEPKDQTGS